MPSSMDIDESPGRCVRVGTTVLKASTSSRSGKPALRLRVGAVCVARWTYSHPDAVDLVALFVHPIDDRTPAMQVDAHVLLCHRGLPCREGLCDNPSLDLRDRCRHGERRPSSFMPSLLGRTKVVAPVGGHSAISG